MWVSAGALALNLILMLYETDAIIFCITPIFGMSLLQQNIVIGSRSQRMGKLHYLLYVGTHPLLRCRGRNLYVLCVSVALQNSQEPLGATEAP
jgi:hypothetical protein